LCGSVLTFFLNRGQDKAFFLPIDPARKDCDYAA
jgi:hypothetical protein